MAHIVQLVRGGAAAVVLAGPAGVGKSRLASRVVADLSGDGWSTDTVRGTASARDTPYGALAHLLPAVMPAGVVNPLRWAMDQVAPTGRRRRLLVVDDAHQLDAASAAVVNHMVEQHRATVVATVRTSEPVPDAIAAMWRGRTADRVELGPLSAEDTARILRHALSGEVESAAAKRLWQLSEGNALLLREIVFAARDSGALIGPPWRLVAPVPVKDPVLVEMVNARVGALGEAEADVLEYVALAEPLAAVNLEQLCPAAAIERCERRQLIRVTGTKRPMVWLAHPIYGEAIRSAQQPLGMRRRYRALVDVIGQSPESPGERLRLAVWRLEAGITQDPAALISAARIAWAAHDYSQATTLAQAAFEVGGGVEAVTVLATLLNYAGLVDRASEVLSTVTTTDGITPRQLTDLTLTRASNLAMTPGRLADAFAELTRVQQVLDDVELRQDLELFQINLLGYTRDHDAILKRSTALLNAPPATPAILAQARSGFAVGVWMRGKYVDAQDSARAALDSIDSWRDAVPVIVVPLHTIWLATALAAGDLASAERALDHLGRETAGRFGWQMADVALRFGRAQLLAARGLLRDAADLLAIEEPGPGAATCLTALAQVLALSGDAAAAGRALDQARHTQPDPIMPIEPEFVAMAESWVQACRGDIPGAVRCTLESAERSIEAGKPALAMPLLYSAVLLGAAVQVVDQLTDMASTMQGPLAPLIGEHARAAADRHGPTLLTVADKFADLGYLPYAADAAAQAAQAFAAERGAGSATARRAAARGAEFVRLCQHLDTPAGRTLTAPDLSTRERQIARLAAAGRTSQEIADELVLSVRTVENHLQHAYNKLGVSGRSELAGLI